MFPVLGVLNMKGRTTCPKCNTEFITEAEEGCTELEVTCPNCNHRFVIKPTAPVEGSSEEECSWEEHGEPRKTILSSIKPQTDRPTIAAVLLIVVFLVGILSAVFPGLFIETPLAPFSGAGIDGSIALEIKNESGAPQSSIQVAVNEKNGTTNETGIVEIKNVPLGIQTVDIYIPENKTIRKDLLVLPFISSVHEITLTDEMPSHEPMDLIWCQSILIIFSVIVLLGATVSWKRQHHDVALFGSVVGIFSVGFFMIGSVLSILALIIIIYSREEFEDGKKGKSF